MENEGEKHDFSWNRWVIIWSQNSSYRNVKILSKAAYKTNGASAVLKTNIRI